LAYWGRKKRIREKGADTWSPGKEVLPTGNRLYDRGRKNHTRNVEEINFSKERGIMKDLSRKEVLYNVGERPNP